MDIRGLGIVWNVIRMLFIRGGMQVDRKEELKLLNKITNALTTDELDDFVKLIWMHDENNIEFIIDIFTREIGARLETLRNL